MKENIILIGFMGSGKTTVGHMIAKELGYEFIDTDARIEEREKMSINEIFSVYGEEAFRKMESDLLREFNDSLSHAVICTGGGLPLREENARMLQTLGVVNYLKVTEEVVVERLKGDTTRPLLAGDNVEQKVKALLLARHPRYQAACQVEIDAALPDPKEVAKGIIFNYRHSLLAKNGK